MAMLHFDISESVDALNGGMFVSPGYGTHATRVIDSYELIFVVRGHLDMFEEDTSFHLERHQTLLLYPGKRHGGLLPYPPDANFYWVHFKFRDEAEGGNQVQIPKVATVEEPELLTELFCRFISDQESGTFGPLGSGHLVTLMLCGLGGQSGRGVRAEAAARKTSHALTEQIRKYIEENYHLPITTSLIARSLGYSPDYLERVYRKRHGNLHRRGPASRPHRRSPHPAAERGAEKHKRDCLRLRLHRSRILPADVQAQVRTDSQTVSLALQPHPHQHPLGPFASTRDREARVRPPFTNPCRATQAAHRST